MYDGKVQNVRYMVSYDEFPIRGGEYDLSKADEVVERLGRQIASNVAAGVYVWCDHPEFNDQKDFVVQFVAGVSEDEQLQIEDDIRHHIEHEWLPAVLDEVGVHDEQEDAVS